MIDLYEKPLIVWTIEQAKASKLLSRFIVSTDDMEIAKIADDNGAEVLLRPPEFATDTATSLDVVKHVLSEIKGKYDAVALLEPTSPLRKKDDIDNAITLMQKMNANSVVSMGKIGLENPNHVYYYKDNNLKKLLPRKIDAEFYFPYGVIYLVKVEWLLRKGKFYDATSVPYFIEEYQNFEIDEYIDILCVEAIMSSRVDL